MENQKKVKLLIILSILIIVALFTVIVFQLVNIFKSKKELASQQQKIEQLEEDLDYYKNKLPNEDYKVIT